jgi:hypothetical protein
MEFSTQRQTFDAYGAAAVSGQASGSFLNVIAAAGGGGTSQTVAAWFTEATTIGETSFFGGNGQPTPGTWTQWFVGGVPFAACPSRRLSRVCLCRVVEWCQSGGRVGLLVGPVSRMQRLRAGDPSP